MGKIFKMSSDEIARYIVGDLLYVLRADGWIFKGREDKWQPVRKLRHIDMKASKGKAIFNRFCKELK